MSSTMFNDLPLEALIPAETTLDRRRARAAFQYWQRRLSEEDARKKWKLVYDDRGFKLSENLGAIRPGRKSDTKQKAPAYLILPVDMDHLFTPHYTGYTDAMIELFLHSFKTGEWFSVSPANNHAAQCAVYNWCNDHTFLYWRKLYIDKITDQTCFLITR